MHHCTAGSYVFCVSYAMWLDPDYNFSSMQQVTRWQIAHLSEEKNVPYASLKDIYVCKYVCMFWNELHNRGYSYSYLMFHLNWMAAS